MNKRCYIEKESYNGNNVIVSFDKAVCPLNFFYGYDKVAFKTKDWEMLKTNSEELNDETFLNLICNVDYGTYARRKLKTYYTNQHNSSPIIVSMENYPEVLCEYGGGDLKYIIVSRILLGVKFNNEYYNELEKEFSKSDKKHSEFYEYKTSGKYYEISGNIMKVTVKHENVSASILIKF